jgi:putative ATPase
MQREGYGKGYRYAHDDPDALTTLQCLPDRLRGRRFYEPTSRGFERTLSERLRRWFDERRKRESTDGSD